MLTAGIDLSDFRAGVAETKRQLDIGKRAAVAAAAVEAAQFARATAPFKDRTGQLRSGIVARFLSNNGVSVEWEILSPAPYSKFVESGTRAHEIWPKATHGLKGPLRNSQTRRATGKGPHEYIVGRGTALRFQIGGRWVFASHVNHPGTHPYPFMGPAYFKAMAVLERESERMVAAVEKIWN